MLESSLVFALPDGRTAEVASRPARLICDRLWELGITAGAATAAARIGDALQGSPLIRADLAFSEREMPPVIEAAKTPPAHLGEARRARHPRHDLARRAP